MGVCPEESFFALFAEAGVPILFSSSDAERIHAVCLETALQAAEGRFVSIVDESISTATHRYIDSHMSIKNALALGVANYAVLAGQISRELKIRSVSAIASSLRRYSSHRTRQNGIDEEILRGLRHAMCVVESGFSEYRFAAHETKELASYLADLSRVGGFANFVASQSGFRVFSRARAANGMSARLRVDRQRIARLEIVASELTCARSGAFDQILALLQPHGLTTLDHYCSPNRLVLHLKEEEIGDAVRAIFARTGDGMPY